MDADFNVKFYNELLAKGFREECIPLRHNLDAYYYAFHRTLSPSINAILDTVAFAGKAAHSTMYWNDDALGYLFNDDPRGQDEYGYYPSAVDLIQMAADAASSEISELKNRISKLELQNEVLMGIIKR